MASPAGDDALREHEQLPNGENRPEHYLAALGEPTRQEDVKPSVRDPLTLEGGQICQRKNGPDSQEEGVLDQNQPTQKAAQ